jgi:hypothetical protein
MKTLLAVLLLSIAAFGECPVTVDEVNMRVPGGRMKVIFKNHTTDKTATNVKYRIVLYDALDDPTELFTDYILTNAHMKPDGGRWFVINDNPREYRPENSRNGVEVYVQKVAFEDKTFWEDDGSKSCRGGDAVRAKHK